MAKLSLEEEETSKLCSYLIKIFPRQLTWKNSTDLEERRWDMNL